VLRNNQKNTTQPDLAQILQNHCPTGSETLLQSWLQNRHVIIRISRDRVSKLGDFRSAQNGSPARISINKGLSQIEFLVTLVHELAHHDTYRAKGIRQRWNRKRVPPHGVEWKEAFRRYIVEIIESGVVEEEVNEALRKCYLMRERIATSPCMVLKRLIEIDLEEDILRVYDLEEGEKFVLSSGRIFIRGIKLRTRYRCQEVKTGKIYTIHGLAEVVKKLV